MFASLVFVPHSFGRRRVVIRKGHVAQRFYFIFSGSVCVTADDDEHSAFAKPTENSVFNRGDYFGVCTFEKWRPEQAGVHDRNVDRFEKRKGVSMYPIQSPIRLLAAGPPQSKLMTRNSHENKFTVLERTVLFSSWWKQRERSKRTIMR